MNPIDIIDRIIAHPLKSQILRAMSIGQDARTGREWARLTKVSPPTLLSHLRTLVNEGIVIRTSVGSSHTFQLNTRNAVVKNMLMPLFQREKNIIPALGQAMQSRLDIERIVSIVIYGSLARGEATANSDWDILILCKQPADIDIVKTQLQTLLPSLRDDLASTIDVKTFATEDFCARYHRGDPFAKGVYRDYLHSVTPNPLYGCSLTELLEAHGKKN